MAALMSRETLFAHVHVKVRPELDVHATTMAAIFISPVNRAYPVNRVSPPPRPHTHTSPRVHKRERVKE